MPTKVEWAQNEDGTRGETWTPIRGCRIKSPGCFECYAMKLAMRMSNPGGAYEGLVKMTPSGPRWTGKYRLVADLLDKPLRWRKPRTVFVCSMSDLFFEPVPAPAIAEVFGVMAVAERHTFQVLTKRAPRMRSLLSSEDFRAAVARAAEWWGDQVGDERSAARAYEIATAGLWPLPNVWCGVSAEDQERADERIPELLETPAAVRFVSYEPALGPLNLQEIPWGPNQTRENVLELECWGDCACPDWDEGCRRQGGDGRLRRIDWVIAGAESGPGARPYELEWFRSVRDQCEEAGASFFLKQTRDDRGKKVSLPVLDGRQWAEMPR